MDVLGRVFGHCLLETTISVAQIYGCSHIPGQGNQTHRHETLHGLSSCVDAVAALLLWLWGLYECECLGPDLYLQLACDQYVCETGLVQRSLQGYAAAFMLYHQKGLEHDVCHARQCLGLPRAAVTAAFFALKLEAADCCWT